MKTTTLWTWGLLALAATTSACSCGSSGDDTCADGVDATRCGQSCEDDTICGAGLHCSGSKQCAAECSASEACAFGSQCTDKGRCIQGCAQVQVDTQNVTPTVLLLVDQSGSMTADFGGISRWEAVKNALLPAPDALVPRYERQVRFGLTLYSAVAPSGSKTVEGTCPRLTTVAPALDNAEEITSVLQPADVLDETPTGDSVRAVIPSLLAVQSNDPKAIIIATDGEPDSCANANPSTTAEADAARAASVSAVRDAYAQGISTYIISVGEGTVSEAHLQAMANAGLGVQAGQPNATIYPAGNPAALSAALSSIVGGTLSCTVTLQGQILNVANACGGTVTLNGRALRCNDADGWRAKDATHIELTGSACTEFLGSRSALEAVFPCDGIIG